ncbi:hypothetical protein [Streptomyces sp. NPDC051173]|uniref:hypothetical protein n=1 Tax=Streptomyces sp. NPDC051173 TaxID=3155164 RepID=UPI00344DA69A
MAWVNILVALDSGPLRRLEKQAEHERAREKEWLAEQREQLLDLSRREASAVRRKIRAELAAKRTSGELGGSRDLLVARAVQEELRTRDLDRNWPEPPEGELSAPGRRWGTPPSRAMGEGGYEERLAVKLPHALAETVRRAAYWTSKDAVEALQEWDDRWGRSGEVVLRDAARDGVPGQLALLAAAMRPSAPQAALEARDRLRAQVLTTGDLMRAAIDRAGRDGQQTEIPAQTSPQPAVTEAGEADPTDIAV